MTNTTEVTNSQIQKLSNEAAEHGDLEQVAICERALAGDVGARAECAKVIGNARGEAEIDPDAQCREHGCARHRCDADHWSFRR